MKRNITDVMKHLEEALKPSQYRAIVKGWDKERYADIFKDPAYKHDRNGYRVFIPISYESRNVQPMRAPADIEKILNDNGFEIQDYVKGIVYNKEKKQSIKIGKVLNKLGRQDLMQKFNNDSRREGTKNKYIAVISRHPYDIAGMSTDRGWTSCMNLKNGINRHFVPLDVKKGSVVAYVTTTDDKNLNNPSGRIMIKPFYDKFDDSGQVYFGMEDNIYGTNVPGFVDAVKEWVHMVNTKHHGLEGVAMITMDDELYADSSTNRVISSNGEGSEGLYDYIKKNINSLPELVENMGYPAIYDINKEDKSVTLENWHSLDSFADDVGLPVFSYYAELRDRIKDNDTTGSELDVDATLEEFNPSVEDYEEVLRYLTDRDLEKIGTDLGISGDLSSFRSIRNMAENMRDSKYDEEMRKAMIKASDMELPTEDEIKKMEALLVDAVYRGLSMYNAYFTITEDDEVNMKMSLTDFVNGISAAEEEDDYNEDGYAFRDRKGAYSWTPEFDTHEMEYYFDNELDDEEKQLYNKLKMLENGSSVNERGELQFDEPLAANIFTKEMLALESVQRIKKLANIIKG